MTAQIKDDAKTIIELKRKNATYFQEILSLKTWALWDEKMKASLGLSTNGNYQNGCMQDIHWTDGAFGYFPSYTLGAMYAAQYKATMQQTVDIDAVTQSGDLSPIFQWLSDNIWSQASLYTTDELIKRATGETLNATHFRKHLETRYL